MLIIINNGVVQSQKIGKHKAEMAFPQLQCLHFFLRGDGGEIF